MGFFKLRWGYPAADGEVSITLLFGAAFKEFTPNLFNWIWEEGGCDEATRDKPWEDLIVRLFDGREPASEMDRLADIIAAFTAKRTKAELVAEARRRRVLLAPVATLSEVMDTQHLEDRGVWDRLPVVAGGPAYRHLGRFIVASGTPLHHVGPAPDLGADSAAVLAEPERSPSTPVPVDGGIDRVRAPRGPQGGRSDVVDRRPVRGPDPGGLRRHRRQGRDAEARRRDPHGDAAPPAQREVPARMRRPVRQLERRQAGPRAGPRHRRRPRGAVGPPALGRRRGRELLRRGVRAHGLRLRAPRGGEPLGHPRLELPARPDRLARPAGLREPLLRHVRLPLHDPLARSAGGGAVRRLHRHRVAPLHAGRAARRHRPPPSHRSGPVPRPLPGGGVAAPAVAGVARRRGQRPRVRLPRQRRRRHGAPRRLPRAGRRPLGRAWPA